MRFRQLLSNEFARRCASNPRYSLRAFARALAVNHGTLSRIINGNGPLASRRVRTLSATLRISQAEVEALCCRENEAAVLAAIRRPSFRPDSRWISSVAGIPIDEVNIALQSLLRGGALRMASSTRWLTAPEELQ